MLTIRPITPADYTTILRWNTDKDEAYLFQWAGFTAYAHPLTEEQLARQAEKENVQIFMVWEDDLPIGTIELSDIDPHGKTGRICRVLFAEETRGKGYGEAALRLLLRYARENCGLRAFSLRVFCYNVPALRCYEKIGFRVTEYFAEKDPRWNNYSMEYTQA